jgi:hypothetical protein
LSQLGQQANSNRKRIAATNNLYSWNFAQARIACTEGQPASQVFSGKALGLQVAVLDQGVGKRDRLELRAKLRLGMRKAAEAK